MKFFRRLAIDLGTANTLIWEAGGELRLEEPTVVAVGIEDRKILAAGSEAKKMLGKVPGYVEVVRPLRQGVVSDYEVTEAMMKYFLRQVMGPWWLVGPEVLVCVPAGVSQVEQRAVLDACLGAGARSVHLIDGPLAVAIGAKIPVSDSFGNLVVSVGGGVIEAAVVALGGVVSHKSIRVGGERVDSVISDYCKKKYNMLIGEQTAEAIKIKIGSGVKLKRPETMDVGGRDLVNGLPKTVTINSDEIYEVSRPILETVLTVIKGVLEETPAELVADIMDRGIVLCGGGAMWRNLDTLVTREIGVSAHVALEPRLCAIKGTLLALENLDVYRRSIK